jgi:hypothetical protein
MAWDSVPWFVGGGAQHSPEVARLMAYAATSGAEGIVTPGDLKVRALAVPGGSVRVAAGAALVKNRATGGTSQTYVARNPIEDVVAIGPTGSGAGRVDLIVAQIEDPFMAGEPWQNPSDPRVGPYVYTRVIPNVPAGTKSLQDIPAYSGRSAITLARVDIPASTGTITSAMITDLRKLALPRESRYVKIIPAGATDKDLTSSTFTFWPPSGNGVNSAIKLPVPSWATKAFIRMDVNSVAHVAPGFIGDLRIKLDTLAGPSVPVDLDLPSGAEHVNQSVWFEVDVTGFQGKDVPIALEGLRRAGYTGLLRTRPSTQYVLEAQFYEAAV